MKPRLYWMLVVLLVVTGNARGQDVITPPWLRTVLPTNALAYVRVPNLWGALGSPKGSVLDALQASDANTSTMSGLREGLQTTWLTPLADAWGPLPQLLLNELSSPLEAAALMSSNDGPPMPQILVTGTLRATTVAEAQAILDRLVQSDERLQWGQSLDAGGYGVIAAMGLPVQVRFQAPEQRLLLLGGLELAPDALAQLDEQLQTPVEHPMQALESEIDASGQGLFLWINTAVATQIAANMAPPPVVAILQLSGAMEMQQLAFGMGVSGGKSRTKLVALMPPTGFRRFLPVPAAELSLNSVSGLETAGVFSLPSVKDWRAFKQLLRQLNPEAAIELEQGEQDIQQFLDSGIEDWWQILGPELVYVSDDAGQYSALRIKDWPRFEALIQSLRERFRLGFEQRQIGSETYTHLSIPSLYSLADEAPQEDEFFGMFLKLFQAATHLYWKPEQEYLLLASVPQVLLDRDQIGPQHAVGEWFSQQIGMPSNNAVLALATQAEGVPLLFYQWHLQLLQYLGDIFGKPVDLFGLPSPRQINLPATGSYGFKLASAPDRLGLEFIYETNPLELLFAGDTMTTLAVAGIIAAIAIPAYQDYTLRTEVSASLAEAQIVQSRLETFYYQQGRLPSAEEFAELAAELAGEFYALEDMYFDPETNTLSVVLAAPADVYGDAVHYHAQLEVGQLSWLCSVESYQPKYYPAECR